ncbi:MAG TPA: hypothetical protein DIU49_02125 [Desulfovibrio sp.]|nr:hypothetical protein [Desulfovibrio sp.]
MNPDRCPPSGLEPVRCPQPSLLPSVPAPDPKAERPMAVMDRANARWGRDTLRLAACGIKGFSRP